MARALWKGTLTFGLVNIPVSLHSNEKKKTFDFNLIDRRDHAPIGYSRVNKKTGQEVESGDIVRSYRLSDGNYVVVPEEEFKNSAPEFARAVRILSFVSPQEINPVYFETPYYLEPVGEGERGYALVLHALTRARKVGIAKVVLRRRERVTMLIPDRALLTLVTLRYASELKHPKRLDQAMPDLDELGVSLREVEVAERLVNQMTSPWSPMDYRDEYREHVLDYVRRRAPQAAGEGTAPAKPEKPKATPGTKILTQLERSLTGAAEAKGRRGSKSA